MGGGGYFSGCFLRALTTRKAAIGLRVLVLRIQERSQLSPSASFYLLATSSTNTPIPWGLAGQCEMGHHQQASDWYSRQGLAAERTEIRSRSSRDTQIPGSPATPHLIGLEDTEQIFHTSCIRDTLHPDQGSRLGQH